MRRVNVRQLRGRRHDRSHHAVEGLLQHGASSSATRSTFVLANSGHIQSLINPPGNPKAFFWAAAARPASAEAWLEGGEAHRKLVAALARVDQGALGREDRRRRGARQCAQPAARRSARPLRHGELGANQPARRRQDRRCASAFGAATRTRPPLLLFNGIGANIELVEPFLEALAGSRSDRLRRAGRRRLAARPGCLIVPRRWRG